MLKQPNKVVFLLSKAVMTLINCRANTELLGLVLNGAIGGNAHV